MHADVQIGDSVVMLGEARDEWTGYKAMIHLSMPDVDEVFAGAVAAGGKPVRDVSTQDYGDRTGGVEDPAGTSGGSRHGSAYPLNVGDLLVVTLYNAQVDRIRKALKEAGFRDPRVGTGDSSTGRKRAWELERGRGPIC